MAGPDAPFEPSAARGERVAVPPLSGMAPATDRAPTHDDDLAQITLRAAQIGIPSWRILVALGLPLPPADG
ncbi:MAG: hypothetical protein QOI73_2478 [Solirubrobacteraceae bacterium]|nr:hypothetical protein [Solirubrobacteraceae bacterium]